MQKLVNSLLVLFILGFAHGQEAELQTKGVSSMKPEQFTPMKFREEKTGWLPDQKFKIQVSDEYAKMALHYWVPDNFREKRLPLIIYLHGGGIPPNSPRGQLGKVPETHSYYEAALGDFWEKSGAIVVGPQVYPNVPDGWCLPGTEEFLAFVILEAVARFNIDPDRVFLIGQSMGGFGAFHIMQNYPDRFAAIVAAAGAWRTANFKNTVTTPIWILHGAKDAVYKERPHFTDIQYARRAVELFQRDNIPVNYRESQGGHRLRNHIEGLEEFWRKYKEMKRDSAFRHIYISTPSGWNEGNSVPVSERGWISITETSPENIEIDVANANGKCGGWKDWDFTEKEFNEWRIDLGRKKIKGAWIDARCLNDNKFDIKTEGIKKFTVWMNDRMVDFSKPINIMVNGKIAFEGRLEPSKENIDECYQKRKDLGLLYEGRAIIEVK